MKNNSLLSGVYPPDIVVTMGREDAIFNHIIEDDGIFHLSENLSFHRSGGVLPECDLYVEEGMQSVLLSADGV